MTVAEVRALLNQYYANDEPHNCPRERDEEFVRCEVCDQSMQAGDQLRYHGTVIANMLIECVDAAKELRGWR